MTIMGRTTDTLHRVLHPNLKQHQKSKSLSHVSTPTASGTPPQTQISSPTSPRNDWTLVDSEPPPTVVGEFGEADTHTSGSRFKGSKRRNGGSLHKLQDLFRLTKTILSPPPTAPDGLTPAEARPATSPDPQRTGLLHDFFQQAARGRLLEDGHALVQALESAVEPIDDREFLLENLVEFLADLDPTSGLQEKLSQAFLKVLWDGLPHPPTVLIGDKYRFRTVDGSYNNVWNPDIGRGGLPYARNVPPQRVLPAWLPDPGVVFDAVLKRDEFVPHPSGISSMLFAFATLIVHTLFRTKRSDPSINETSSYLDLSVLYGHDQPSQDKMRTRVNGGIWPDTYAEFRLLSLPPPVTGLLLMFNRNHGYVVEKLLQINEYGKFKDWEGLSEQARAAQDEELFQTARLINSSYFVQVVLHDYLRTILGLSQTSSTWSLDPREEIKILLSSAAVPRGVGNHSSIEFSCLYTWHSSCSEPDEKWTVDEFQRLFGDDRDPGTITPVEFTRVAGGLEAAYGDDPRIWDYPGLGKRGEDGRFTDEDLANVMNNATEAVSGAFGAFQVPDTLRVIEIMRMLTARNTWRACTLNEFRTFLGLKPFTEFVEHNSDPKVWKRMEQMYVHPDNIELYIGLLAEEAKPTRVGSGLCPGYTISRAILNDAVALVRGDRFFTTGYDRASLTSWGFEDCASIPTNGAYGGMLGKLFMRSLPRAYKLNSVHALFPFITPQAMHKNLSLLKVAYKYDFERPKSAHKWHGIKNREAVRLILTRPEVFGVVYSAAIRNLSVDDYGFMLGFDDYQRHDPDRHLMESVLYPQGFFDDYTKFYSDIMQKLIAKHSFGLGDGKVQNLDFVRDCSTMASVFWAARTFGIPLKTKETPHGILTPQELYLMLTGMFIYVFIMPLQDPSMGWTLRETSVKNARLLAGILEARFRGVTSLPSSLLPGRPGTLLDPGPHALKLYRHMLATKRPINELVSNCMGILVASTSNQGQMAANALNLYLQPEHRDSYDRLVELANQSYEGDEGVDKEIRAYVMEAMRLDPQTPAVPRVCKEGTQLVKDGNQTIRIEQGDFVLASLRDVNLDPAVFPEPYKVKTDRDPKLYRVFSFGMHSCLGARIVEIGQTQMLKAAFRLKGLCRAPGKAGELVRFAQSLDGIAANTYINATNNIWPFPVSLSIQYDAE